MDAVDVSAQARGGLGGAGCDQPLHGQQTHRVDARLRPVRTHRAAGLRKKRAEKKQQFAAKVLKKGDKAEAADAPKAE